MENHLNLPFVLFVWWPGIHCPDPLRRGSPGINVDAAPTRDFGARVGEIGGARINSCACWEKFPTTLGIYPASPGGGSRLSRRRDPEGGSAGAKAGHAADQRIATPQGSSPTLTSAIALSVSVSMNDTAFERPHAT